MSKILTLFDAYDYSDSGEDIYPEEDHSEEEEEVTGLVLSQSVNTKKKQKVNFKANKKYIPREADERNNEALPDVVCNISHKLEARLWNKPSWSKFNMIKMDEDISVRKSGMATFLLDDVLYIHGGTNGRTVFNDMYAMNTKNNQVTQILQECDLPSMAYHAIIVSRASNFQQNCHSHQIVFCDATSTYLWTWTGDRKDINNTNGFIRKHDARYFRNHNYAAPVATVDHSICTIGTSIYIFGGNRRSDENPVPSNDIYCVTPKISRLLLKSCVDNKSWPAPRYSHAAATYGREMFYLWWYWREQKCLE